MKIKCGSCTNDKINCQNCSGNRVDAPICNCPLGLWEKINDPLCYTENPICSNAQSNDGE
jgi:hypothetical protein